MQTQTGTAALTALLGTALWISTQARAAIAIGTNHVRGEFHELNDNGAWSWFMDERAVVDTGRLIVGSVRANGTFRDNINPGWGNVELAVLDLQSGQRRVVVLHQRFEQDDHNGPGEIAYAGKRLYPGEDDYTGLGSIDPQNTSVVYLSTDADPKTGQPLISAADGERHHEIFRGETRDGGATWQWTSITQNSRVDNLRPIVPAWNDPRNALVWMRGTYLNNRGEWTTKVVVTILRRSDF